MIKVQREGREERKGNGEEGGWETLFIFTSSGKEHLSSEGMCSATGTGWKINVQLQEGSCLIFS